jgi:YtcA family
MSVDASSSCVRSRDRRAGPSSCPRAAGGLLTMFGLLGLGGCDPGPPSLSLVGSYFPAWILCSLIGVAVGLATRVVLSATRLAQTAAYPLVVCIAIAVIAGVTAWLVFYRW